jgi:hypothetical protein
MPNTIANDRSLSPDTVEVPLDDNRSLLPATGPARDTAALATTRRVRRTVAVLALGALGGGALAHGLTHTEPSTASIPAPTATVTAGDTLADCRLRPGGCTTEEYRVLSPTTDAASTATSPHVTLGCQLQAGGCSTEAYRLVPAAALPANSCR